MKKILIMTILILFIPFIVVISFDIDNKIRCLDKSYNSDIIEQFLINIKILTECLRKE